jgi:uncharacterized repeat protein (TIGR02543 family)
MEEYNASLFAKDGHVLGQLTFDQEGNIPVSFNTKVTEDMTVYIQWNAAYIMTFEFNGGINAYDSESTSMDSPLVTEGNNLIQFAPSTEGEFITLTKEGFTFDGWYYEDTFDTLVGPEDTTPAQNITLYAKWVPVNP